MARKKDKIYYELEDYFSRHSDWKNVIVWKLIQAGDYLVYHDNRVVRTVGTPIAMGIGVFAVVAKKFILK